MKQKNEFTFFHDNEKKRVVCVLNKNTLIKGIAKLHPDEAEAKKEVGEFIAKTRALIAYKEYEIDSIINAIRNLSVISNSIAEKIDRGELFLDLSDNETFLQLIRFSLGKIGKPKSTAEKCIIKTIYQLFSDLKYHTKKKNEYEKKLKKYIDDLDK